MARDIGLLVLRLGVGLMMLFGHGWGKLMRFPELLHKFPDPLGMGSELSLVLAVLTEVGCSVLIAAGLATRPAALGVLITMITAAFVVHGDDPFSKKELALMYAIPYATLLLTGAGRFSLDALVHPLIKRSRLGRLVRT